jgi:hypothetical protein
VTGLAHIQRLAHDVTRDVTTDNNAKLQTSMNIYNWSETATYLAWRLAGYALLNLGEDAALLALMFC